jgi:acetyl esterase/lipase
MELDRLEAVRASVVAIESGREKVPDHGLYRDFRAAFHVRVGEANATSSGRDAVLRAARSTGTSIVVWADSGEARQAAWHGLRQGVLFLAGEEDEGMGRFVLPDINPDGAGSTHAPLTYFSRPIPEMDAPAEGFDGMEIVNRRNEVRLEAPRFLSFMTTQDGAPGWADVTNAFARQPDAWFAACSDYRPQVMAKWDQELGKRRFVGIGSLGVAGNATYRGVNFDPFELAFRHVSTHIYARKLTEAAIKESLREGRAYVSHDWLADPTGFTFGGVNNLGVFTTGDNVPWLGKTRIVAITPLPAKLRIIHGGRVVAETQGTRVEVEVASLGAYRAEAWLQVGGEDRPWIYSNPVYVQLPTPAMLTLPSGELAPTVQVAKDITYTEGSEADAGKHKLDIYTPRQGEQFPVILFVHGGAWKSGDRSQYPAIGNRFAKEGVCFVAPSYRLAPKNPHPAQIEDAAAAFAWTVKNIARYGGDPRRIYIAGHSAGGHLVGLLALDARWLKPHGLDPGAIRGVIAMSGVYDLLIGDAADNVFGRDPARRRDASPMTFVQKPAPQFLVTYCQWDYLLLPAQAVQFHAALRRAGVNADLVYVPGENHISEVISMTRDQDRSVEAILGFIKR